jgi:hypothetical protein
MKQWGRMEKVRISIKLREATFQLYVKVIEKIRALISDKNERRKVKINNNIEVK